MRLFASRSSRLAALVLLALPGWSPTLPAAEQRVDDPRDLPEFPPVSYTGLIINETAGSVTIRQPLGAEVAVARVQIARMQASRLSLMPEGLEEGWSNQDLADLADFIMADSRQDQTP